METVKEMQRRALVRDIEDLIREKEAVAEEAMEKMHASFSDYDGYSKASVRFTAAHFCIGFLRQMKESIADLDIKLSLSLVRYHAEAQKKAVLDVIDSEELHRFSELLEELADRAEERRRWEIEPELAEAV